MKTEILLQLFVTFFKIGSFTFGGGFAMIPLIEKEVVHRKNWVEQDELIDILALSQAVPGAVAINTSTSIGQKVGGKLGAVAATLGVILPSILIILLIAVLFTNFQENPYVQAALQGISPAVVALIALSAYKVGKSSIKDRTSWMIAGVTVVAVVVFDVHAVFAILGGAVIGAGIFWLFPRHAEQIAGKRDDT